MAFPKFSCSPKWGSRLSKNLLGKATFGYKTHRRTNQTRYYCKFLPEAKNENNASMLEFGPTVGFEVKGNSLH